jgi:hypothetical protein
MSQQVRWWILDVHQLNYNFQQQHDWEESEVCRVLLDNTKFQRYFFPNLKYVHFFGMCKQCNECRRSEVFFFISSQHDNKIDINVWCYHESHPQIYTIDKVSLPFPFLTSRSMLKFKGNEMDDGSNLQGLHMFSVFMKLVKRRNSFFCQIKSH